MSQNSSISSSEARFLALLAGLTLVLLALAWAFTKATLWAGRAKLPYQTLVEYQFAKVKEGPVPETVFVGDSSLGNSIDAHHWQALSGQVTSNLALTGAFGYVGSFSMLRETLKRGKPKNVLIVQTADMLTRTSADEDWVLALDPKPTGLIPSLLHEWRVTMNSQEIANAASWLGNILLVGGKPMKEAGRLFLSNLTTALGICKTCRIPQKNTVLANDYIRQGAPRKIQGVARGFNAERIRPAKTAYLANIAALCRAEGLNCFYAYGPLADPTCSLSDEYFARSSALIRKTGIALVHDKPFCFAPEIMGDSNDHVAPQYKQVFTEKYFDLLKSHLLQSVATAERAG